MAKKKSINPKLDSKTQKPPKAKQAKVDHLHPKAKNKSSVTGNIKSISAKSVEDSGLGKIPKSSIKPKTKRSPKTKRKGKEEVSPFTNGAAEIAKNLEELQKIKEKRLNQGSGSYSNQT